MSQSPILFEKFKREINHLLAMIKKEWIVFTRYPIAIIGSFATPLFLVLIFSFTAISFLGDPTEAQRRSVGTFMFIGILGYIYLNISTITAQGVRDEQHQGTLESLFLTSANRYLHILARILVRLAVISLNGIVIYIAISLALEPITFENPIIGGLLFFMLMLQFIGIGFAVAGLTFRFKETAMIGSNFLVFLLMIFGSFFYRFDSFPKGILRTIPKFIPISYTIDAIRAAVLGFPPGFPELMSFRTEVFLSVISTFIMLFGGIAIYIHYDRKIRKDASLAEY